MKTTIARDPSMLILVIALAVAALFTTFTIVIPVVQLSIAFGGLVHAV